MYTIKSAVSSSLALGTNLYAGGASIRVWAPNASAVEVRLAPAGTVAAAFTSLPTLPLSPDPASPGYWSADIDGVATGDLYQFQITNRGGDAFDSGGQPFLRIDPCARQVISSDQRQPGYVVNPKAFAWKANFKTPAFADFIVYQAHIGSFAGRGDSLPVYIDTLDGSGTASFNDVRAKIGYVRSLNFNAIQFLPNGEYRGVVGEAYNPSNFYAPESYYGSPSELRQLIDACHDQGMAVLFDVVYNHMDFVDNLWQFDGNSDHRVSSVDPSSGGGIYFSAIDTGFGRRPDHDNPNVQRFFRDNAEMWFSEYRVDGLRFDSVVNFSASGLAAIVQPLLAKYPDKLIYAEDSDPGYVFGAIGFRACWDMGSADGFARLVGSHDLGALQNLISRFGYPTAWSAIKYLLGSHDQIFNQWERANDGRTWVWDKPAHDGLRENRYFVEKIGGPISGRNNWFALAQARMGWALNTAMPCTPMMFMGSECHHNGYWNPDTDPFGDHRFDWSIARDSIGMPMRNLVSDVNAVRTANPALRSDAGPEMSHIDSDNGVLAFKRWDSAGNVVLTVVNLSDNQWSDATYGVAAGIPGDKWTEIFNSQSPQYGGWNDSGNYLANLQVADDGRIAIRLPKWSVLIFRKQ
jgi:1,4-alpha-glucan branching enzyme